MMRRTSVIRLPLSQFRSAKWIGASAANTWVGVASKPKVARTAASNRRNPFMLLHLVLFTAMAGWSGSRPRSLWILSPLTVVEVPAFEVRGSVFGNFLQTRQLSPDHAGVWRRLQLVKL